MILHLDRRTELHVYTARGNKVAWELQRVVDGRKKIIMRGPSVARADFDLKSLLCRMRSVRIADSMPGAHPKPEDVLED